MLLFATLNLAARELAVRMGIKVNRCVSKSRNTMMICTFLELCTAGW